MIPPDEIAGGGDVRKKYLKNEPQHQKNQHEHLLAPPIEMQELHNRSLPIGQESSQSGD